MIIGAFYWGFLFFGGGIMFVMGAGVVAELQQRPLDIGSIIGATAIGLVGALIAIYSGRALLHGNAGFVGARAGPAFGTDRMASSGCLFVLLLVGSGLLLYGPIVLVQLPSIDESEQPTFVIGGAVSFALGVVMVAPTLLSLWLRRKRGPTAEADRLLIGVVGGFVTFLVGGALLLTTFFDPRYDVGVVWQLVIGGLAALGAIGASAFGVALSRKLR